MPSYLIKKCEKTNKILYMEYEFNGYEFSPKIKDNKSQIKVNHITLINPSMIEKTLMLKLKKSFKKAVGAALVVISDDDSGDGEINLALDEVRKLAGIIINRYHKFLKQTVEKEYLTRLALIEKELMMKQFVREQMLMMNQDLTEEKTRSR